MAPAALHIVKDHLKYRDAEGRIYEGWHARLADIKANEKLPGVLVIHAFAGCSEFEMKRAEQLAKLGYIALAVDLYGKGKRGNTKEEGFALLRPLMADRDELTKRLKAARDALATLANLGAIGYCFGGMCAIDMARRNMEGIRAVVSFHGTLEPIPGADLTGINASLQLSKSPIPCGNTIHNGEADPHIDQEQKRGFYDEMRTRKADFQFIDHSGALHGFTEPHADQMGESTVAYHKKAAKRSWLMARQFLREMLM